MLDKPNWPAVHMHTKLLSEDVYMPQPMLVPDRGHCGLDCSGIARPRLGRPCTQARGARPHGPAKSQYQPGINCAPW